VIRPLVYIDTSTALAHLLNEDVVPPERIWRESLVSSRLLEYEAWRRLHTMGVAESHGDSLRSLLSGVAMLDLAEPIVGRARDALPHTIRTLDALHVAAMLFLREQGQRVRLATYDARMKKVAFDMGVPLYDMT
jgi:predicted nucleic acid-binding protein